LGERKGKPFFVRGSPGYQHGDSEDLLYEEGRTVQRWSNVTYMRVERTWTAAETAIAERYCVRDLELGWKAFASARSADFLIDLPLVRRMSISLSSPIDLSALGRITQLEKLRITMSGWRLSDRFEPVDLSGLANLWWADVAFSKTFESILKCSSIQELTIENSGDGRLRDLDLSSMNQLADLTLDHCSKLRRVDFHPKAKVRKLEVSLCGPYRIDWERLGRDLRGLTLGGRISFPLEEILGAPRLEQLAVMEVRKLPGLGFLRELKKLKGVTLFSAPPGPNISEEDWALVREINGKGKGRKRGAGGRGK
jgi:hypothetical protein